MSDIFEKMELAVAAAQRSHHPDNKVGTHLSGKDLEISSSNVWPAAIEEKFGRTLEQIGNASPTVHAELMAIIKASVAGIPTLGADVFSTDPSCPNCAKGIADAGARHLYIDHKGFEKDFAQRRFDDFRNKTLAICGAAGIGITKVFRKQRRTEEILAIAPNFKFPQKNGFRKFEPHDFTSQALETYGDKPWSGAISLDGSFALVTPEEFTPGFKSQPTKNDEKYDFKASSLNRLFMVSAREGIRLDLETVQTSHIPYSREFINALGAGISTIRIHDMDDTGRKAAHSALETLANAGILEYGLMVK